MKGNPMRRITVGQMAVALLISIGTLLVLETSGANDKGNSSAGFHLTVVDVVGDNGVIVKQLRIDAKPDSLARISTDKKGGGGVSASAGSVDNRPDQGTITVSIFADHIEWKAGNVNALKFFISIQGNGSKALMSDTGPMAKGKQLNDLLAVTVESANYEYGAAIPVLRFKDKTFSLVVTAPASAP